MSERCDLLIIDDEESICFAFRRYFEARGRTVAVASNGDEGLRRFDAFRPRLVFLDVRLPDCNGIELMGTLRQRDPAALVVIITAYGSLSTATAAARHAAFDFMAKPLDLDRAAELVDQALVARRERPKPAVAVLEADGGPLMIGHSQAMQTLYKQVGRAAVAESAVLILGETGTGKELAARAIHAHGDRHERPFVAVNCGALPEHLVESELFGYAQGAFTGATGDKPGRFEMADGGVLFLDEIGELPPAAQVKLLRFLDLRTVERLGSVTPIHLDVRILAATNRDLPQCVEAGTFRADLYYRLAVIQVRLPPLRDRRSDIVLLAEHFLHQGGAGPQLSEAAAAAITAYDWPGNVRELRNAMEHARVVSGGAVVLPMHLPDAVGGGSPGPSVSRGDRWETAAARYLDVVSGPEGERYRTAVEGLERVLIGRELAAADGNQSLAASRLGLHRNTLREKIRVLGLR